MTVTDAENIDISDIGDERGVKLRVDPSEEAVSALYAQQLSYQNSDEQREYLSEFSDVSDENVYARLLTGERFPVDELYEALPEYAFRTLMNDAEPVADTNQLQVDPIGIKRKAERFGYRGHQQMWTRDYGNATVIGRTLFGRYRGYTRENADLSDVTDDELERFNKYGSLPEKFEDREYEWDGSRSLKHGFGIPVGMIITPGLANTAVSVPEEATVAGIVLGMGYMSIWHRKEHRKRTIEDGIEDALRNEYKQRNHDRIMQQLKEEYVGKGYVLEADLDMERDEPDTPPALSTSFTGLDPDQFQQFYEEIIGETIVSAGLQDMEFTDTYDLAMQTLLESGTTETGYTATDLDADYVLDEIRIDAERIGELTRYRGTITGTPIADTPLFEEDLESEHLFEITAMIEEAAVGETFETILYESTDTLPGRLQTLAEEV